MKADDPITMAQYAKEHDLLDKDGWKSLRKYTRREKKLAQLIQQVRLRSFWTSPTKYQYGY